MLLELLLSVIPQLVGEILIVSALVSRTQLSEGNIIRAILDLVPFPRGGPERRVRALDWRQDPGQSVKGFLEVRGEGFCRHHLVEQWRCDAPWVHGHCEDLRIPPGQFARKQNVGELGMSVPHVRMGSGHRGGELLRVE